MANIEYSNNSNQNFTFDQWTGVHSDPCEYKQSLNLATKPLQYYVNSLNNVSGTQEPHLTFTPVGNAKGEHISNIFERPIPSTLQKSSATYTTPYATSPFIGAQNNFNPVDTDTDLTLKTGLELRPKNLDLSNLKWPSFGDIHSHSIKTLYNNAGQFYGKNSAGDTVLSNRMNQTINGLNEQQSKISQGTGAIWPDYSGHQIGADTYQMQLNYQNGPHLSGAEIKKQIARK